MNFVTNMHPTGRMTGTVSVDGLNPIEVAYPVQFGGPAGIWTPEDLLSASVASCFEFTLGHVLKQKKVEVKSLDVSSALTLEKSKFGFRFTQVRVTIDVTVAEESPGILKRIAGCVDQARNHCPVTAALQLDEQTKLIVNGKLRPQTISNEKG